MITLMSALWRRAWIIALISVVLGAICFAWARFLITPTYEASALMYVNNTQDPGKPISNSELSAAQSLVDTYMVILSSRTTLDQIRSAAKLTYTDKQLTKPFGVMELVSCVKAVLRRCARPSHVLHLSGLTLDQDAHTVSCDGQRVPLTYKEYELLRLFLSHPGMAFTRDQLMAQVWGTDYYGETRTVDMHIRTLRQKLGPYGGLIQTVRNVGYRLEEQG